MSNCTKCRHACSQACKHTCHKQCDWSECSECESRETNNKKNIYEVEYSLCSDRLMIIDNDFTELLYFPWLDKDNVLRTGTIIFGTQINNSGAQINNSSSNNGLQVQVFDTTTTTVLGRSQIIKESGVHKFNFRIPQNDAQLTIMFKKISGVGNDPQVYGVTLNYKCKN